MKLSFSCAICRTGLQEATHVAPGIGGAEGRRVGGRGGDLVPLGTVLVTQH